MSAPAALTRYSMRRVSSEAIYFPDKDPREFDLVFDVKADGWFNLLQRDRPDAAARHRCIQFDSRPIR